MSLQSIAFILSLEVFTTIGISDVTGVTFDVTWFVDDVTLLVDCVCLLLLKVLQGLDFRSICDFSSGSFVVFCCKTLDIKCYIDWKREANCIYNPSYWKLADVSQNYKVAENWLKAELGVFKIHPKAQALKPSFNAQTQISRPKLKILECNCKLIAWGAQINFAI